MILADITSKIEVLKVISNDSVLITNVQSIASTNFGKESIGWCSDKNIELIKNCKEGTILISENSYNNNTEIFHNQQINFVIVKNPRLTFSKILSEFFVKKVEYGMIHSSVLIHPSASYNPQEVIIEPNVVVESNVTLGSNVIIGANTVIKSDTFIHSNVKIGSNCTIGGVGFGYEKNEDGFYDVIPHVGNVVLHEGVEIGNNTCIDRAVMGSTILHKNVKIDNLVHIAHGVEIGENSLVIAHAMIAGSVSVGTNSWIAPCSSIRQKLTVGNDVTVGMGSVVVKNVSDGEIVAGVPAKKIN